MGASARPVNPVPLLARGGRTAVLAVIATLLVIASCGPVVWMINSSLKSTGELFVNRWGLPQVLQWSNYAEVWVKAQIGAYFWNSVMVSFVAVGLMMVLGAMASFGIVRFHGQVKTRGIFYYFVAGQMITAEVVAVAVFLLVWAMGGLNSLLVLSLVYTAAGLPFVIILLRGFFASIQTELFDAAVIDGCNEMRIFLQVVVPLSRPVLASAIIFQFNYVWNEFILSLILIRDRVRTTLPVGVLRAVTDQYNTEYALAFAAVTITSIPIIAVYLLFQRHFVGGLSGAVKG